MKNDKPISQKQSKSFRILRPKLESIIGFKLDKLSKRGLV